VPLDTSTSGAGIPFMSVNNIAISQSNGRIKGIPYQIGYTADSNGNPLQVVLTDQQNAGANYTVNQQNPQSWDALFTAAFVASLAAYLVPALSLDKQLMSAQIAIAERAIASAQSEDGNEGITVMDNIPDWILARQGANAYLGASRPYAAYGTMAWPL